MRFWPRSIRLRLTLWYAAALTIIVVAFSAAVYLLVRRSLTGQAEAQLERDLSVLRRVIADDLHDLHELDEHGSIMYFRIRGAAGVLFETADWKRAHLAGAAADGQSGVTRHWHSPSDHTFFLRSDSVTAPPQGQEHLPGMLPGEQLDMTVATDAELAEQSLHTLLLALVLGVPCAALAAIVGGYFLAGRVLSPVGAMAKKAAQITADNLGERLPVENSGDELGRLATVFNETLARIGTVWTFCSPIPSSTSSSARRSSMSSGVAPPSKPVTLMRSGVTSHPPGPTMCRNAWAQAWEMLSVSISGGTVLLIVNLLQVAVLTEAHELLARDPKKGGPPGPTDRCPDDPRPHRSKESADSRRGAIHGRDSVALGHRFGGEE